MAADAWEEGTDRPADGHGLTLRTVEYPNSPDRCTLYPADMEPADRLTLWISVDRSAVVSLRACR